ncbi:MAG TPA: FMN-binding negative transcriptional regulator [Candidatus Limnocylindria bacterium]|jgi:transcriptional regulator|nr:FMN-binding negative transcriptional regulator [Candidatus Limnocylindria bacterium]
MYVPAAFASDDAAAIRAVIAQHPFATLVTVDGAEPFATHLPLLQFAGPDAPGTLVGHVAKANPQWRHLETGRDVLAIFHGPHAYVSPSWYEVKPAVPTWNYVAVHAYGKARLITDTTELQARLRELTVHFESGLPQPWAPDLPEDYWQHMMRALVGFEISVTRLEGKFKLSQNRSANDVQGVIRALSQSGQPMDREVAGLMQAAVKK